MIEVGGRGDFSVTRKALEKMRRANLFSDLDRYGQQGVDALAKATPIDENLTAISWAYRIVHHRKYPGIEWYNTNETTSGTPVAILIQYGHGTGTGGYVAGRDFINPAIRPIFDRIANDVWKKVTNG